MVVFYFGTRSAAPETPPTPGGTEKAPLYMPRGSVRTVLLLGFLGITAYVYYETRQLPAPFIDILKVIGGYLAGALIAAIVRRTVKGPSRLRQVFGDLNALACIGVIAFFAASELVGPFEFVPPAASNLMVVVVAYYFGARR